VALHLTSSGDAAARGREVKFLTRPWADEMRKPQQAERVPTYYQVKLVCRCRNCLHEVLMIQSVLKNCGIISTLRLNPVKYTINKKMKTQPTFNHVYKLVETPGE
jgi:hypothetical protein